MVGCDLYSQNILVCTHWSRVRKRGFLKTVQPLGVSNNEESYNDITFKLVYFSGNESIIQQFKWNMHIKQSTCYMHRMKILVLSGKLILIPLLYFKSYYFLFFSLKDRDKLWNMKIVDSNINFLSF